MHQRNAFSGIPIKVHAVMIFLTACPS
jgi:hypothetical protein